MKRIGRKSRRYLAIETDGFSLRAAVVRLSRDGAMLEHTAESQATDRITAMADVIGQFEKSALPSRGVLVTPEVVPAVLELPVDPKHPRPWSQMQQLIRWELEPYLAQQMAPRRIGELLACRGDLSDEQVATVVEELERLRQEVSAGTNTRWRTPPRFGEVAVEMGLLTSDKVDEALRLQEQSGIPEADEFVCGWSAQTEETGTTGPSRWLVAGISRQARRQWADLFAAHGVELAGIYPLIGTSRAVLDWQQASRSASLLDVHLGWMGAAQFIEGSLDSVQMQPVASRSVSAEMCLELIDSLRGETLWLAGSHPELPELQKELESQTGREIRLVECSVEPSDFPAQRATVIGAVYHTAGVVDATKAVSVLPQDPGPPIWQQPRTWWLSTAAAGVLLLGGVETLQMLRMEAVETAQVEAETKLKRIQEDIAQVERRIERAEELQKSLDQREQQLHSLEERLTFWQKQVPRRGRLVSAILTALAESASEEIALNRAAETARGGLEIEAWSLSEPAAQQFALKLTERLRRWGLAVDRPRVESETGRLELPGYAITLQLEPRTWSKAEPTLISGREN